MKKVIIISFIALFISLFSPSARAQFRVDGQIVQRGEYRHGYGRLIIGEGEEAALFIGQGARVNAQYKMDNFRFFVSIQDVRTWGNTPQVKATDGFLSVHEAWAETKLLDKLSVKLGRQELNYDNFRFLGNLDCALQGRAHDLALLKYGEGNRKLHAGAGYNQEGERLSGTLYTMPRQYKAALFARYESVLSNFSFSALFWNYGLQYAVLDTAGQLIEKEIRYRQTLGLPTLKYQLGNTTLSGFYYYQFGQDVAGRPVRAFDASAQLSQLFPIKPDKGQKLRLTAGIEVLSGTDRRATVEVKNSFSPFYGTNHAHSGYMDLFFVGGRFENGAGLQDVFLRVWYDFNPSLFVSLNSHSFSTQAGVYQENKKLSKSLGYETDLALGYILNEAVSLQSGYSQLLTSETMEQLQGIQNPASVQNWAYLMMIYRPTMKNRFIGLLF